MIARAHHHYSFPAIIPAVIPMASVHIHYFFVVPASSAVIITIVITFMPVAVTVSVVAAAPVLCLCSCIGCPEEEHHENQLFHSLLF